MDILIYGSGKYCEIFLKNLEKKKIIKGIVDSDSSKWGLNQGGYIINSPDFIKKIHYDELIIAVQQYESVLDELLKKDIDKNKVYIYNGDKNDIFHLNSVYEKYIENKICKSKIVNQIKIGLLLESFKDGEYCGFERIHIIGDEDDYLIVKKFFSEVDPQKTVVYDNDNNTQIRENDKYIFCGKNYKNILMNLRKNLFTEKQWIILPFFDVANNVRL